MPTACSSAASARANRSASFSSAGLPTRPSVSIGGHSVNGRFNRATRPPSWSTLTHSGSSEASACDCRDRSATCSGASTLRAKKMTPPRSNSRASDRTSGGRSCPSKPTIANCPTCRRSSRKDIHHMIPMYDFAVHIHASAPTRIDLAGGTLDIWPLYLFHDGAQTLNAAISLRASCDLRGRSDDRLVIVSEDSGERVEADHWSQLRDTHDLTLLGKLLHYFQAQGLELTTRSDSPVGAGIAGSSALNIAVCGALNAWSGGHRSADEI